MKSLFRKVLLLGVFAILLTPAIAQSSCPGIVSDAIDYLSRACTRVGRNQACYGNLTLNAQPQAGVTDLKFAAPGDIESIARISALTLSGMNEAVPEWGVALMLLQASLPNLVPGQNVTFLLFGSTQLTRDDATATAAGYGNGMQAFTIASGIGDAHCAEAPDSGLLVQTNRGNVEVVFTVNGVQIWMESTVYIQSVPGGSMFIYLVEGKATVSAFGVSRAMPSGTMIMVPVGGDGRAVAPPPEPQGYNMGVVQRLSVLLRLLPRRISLASPLDLSVCTLIAPANANTRQGPGADFRRVESLSANAPQVSTGSATGSDGVRWYQLANGAWVSETVVDMYGPCATLPQVVVPANSSNNGSSGVACRDGSTIQIRAGELIRISDFLPVQNVSSDAVVSTFTAGGNVIFAGAGTGSSSGIAWNMTWAAAPGTYTIEVVHTPTTRVQPDWADAPFEAGQWWQHLVCQVQAI